MVTRQGKDLLRNTIRSTGYHNRLLEEDDMWRQWDLERGLTMMVTDDCLKKKLRMDQYATPLKSSNSESNKDNYWTKKLFETEEKDPDRWGHSGYKELYPEEFNERKSSSSTSSERRKCRKSTKTHRNERSRKKHKKDKISKSKKSKNSSKKCVKELSDNSSTEEGECESKSDVESILSESSIDETLKAEQLQRLARFRRHFRSCSVEKEEKNGFSCAGNSVLWTERSKCENEEKKRKKKIQEKFKKEKTK